MRGWDPGSLVREARRRVGLTQRALARRAHTAQSVVARVETGQTSPTAPTLKRLLSAAGFDLRVQLVPQVPPDSHMLDDVRRILALTPEERLLELRNLSRFETAARRA